METIIAAHRNDPDTRIRHFLQLNDMEESKMNYINGGELYIKDCVYRLMNYSTKHNKVEDIKMIFQYQKTTNRIEKEYLKGKIVILSEMSRYHLI